jgi:hypothetical protein
VTVYLRPGPRKEKAEREVARWERFKSLTGQIAEVNEAIRADRSAAPLPSRSAALILRAKKGLCKALAAEAAAEVARLVARWPGRWPAAAAVPFTPAPAGELARVSITGKRLDRHA